MQHLTPFIELCDDRVPYDTGMQPNIGSHSIFLRRALNRKFHETFQKEGFSDTFYRRLNLAFRTIPRLALYVPFNWLDRAPDYFISTYLDYWQRCWTMQDARENFNLGDIYEPEARIGEVEYIVKAMHLLPDLLRIGYLDEEDVVKIAQKSRRRDPLLCHSLLDTLPVLCGENLMQQQTAELILRITREVSPRPAPPQLAFVTPKREAWLAEMAEDYQVKPQYISGPFSLNCDEDFLARIANLDKTKIALIGGSRLKGYARDDSDYDVAWLDPQTGEMSGTYQSKVGTADPNIIHLLMNTVWASANDAYSLKSIREEHSFAYSVNASIGMQDMPESHFILQTIAPVTPEKTDSALALIDEGLKQLAEKPAPADVLAKTKEQMLKSYENSLRENSYWQGLAVTRILFGRDGFTGYKEAIEAVTPEDVQAFVRDVVLKQNNRLNLLMTPAAGE